MKIRTDFVTNSSSSSYVIAFKGLPKIDENTLEKYPFLKEYQKIVKNAIYSHDTSSYDTEDTDEIENVIDLQNYLLGMYAYDHDAFKQLCDDNEYIRDIYKECVEKIEKGYKILFKEVGHDDYRNGLFESMESDDFIILEGK